MGIKSEQRQSGLKEISFDELPEYSDWPRRLIQNKSKFKKTSKEVDREFNLEKWNETLELIINSQKTILSEIENEIYPQDSESLFYEQGKFWKTTHGYGVQRHLELYRNTILSFINGAAALVELGAGYGSKAFALKQTDLFSDVPLIIGELTENGRNASRLLAKKLKIDVKVGACDFRVLSIDKELVPYDSVIFTSYAMHYVPKFPKGIIDYFLKLKPRVVIHFEPLFETLDNNSVHSLLCQEYIKQNDYTTNLYSRILRAEEEGKIKVLELSKKVMGQNPLLPISVIIWKPL